MKGLKARGGYELDMTWKAGKLTRVVVRSALGGNCRLRLPNALAATGTALLKPPAGPNPNPFYALPDSQYRTTTPETATNGAVVYDLATVAGGAYTLVGK